jgi:hypothetical protein
MEDNEGSAKAPSGSTGLRERIRHGLAAAAKLRLSKTVDAGLKQGQAAGYKLGLPCHFALRLPLLLPASAQRL